MKKRCKHIQSTTTWRRDTSGSEYAFARHCSTCHAQLSLGPSNDGDGGIRSDIFLEIQAVRLEFGAAVADISWVEADGYGAHLEDADPPPDATLGWHIGWLVRELRTHEHRDNSDRYDWDLTRPLAEQSIGTVERADALVIESDAPEAPLPLEHASDPDLGGES